MGGKENKERIVREWNAADRLQKFKRGPEKLNYLDCLGNKKKIPKEIGL